MNFFDQQLLWNKTIVQAQSCGYPDIFAKCALDDVIVGSSFYRSSAQDLRQGLGKPGCL